jgi:hypothetical protein
MKKKLIVMHSPMSPAAVVEALRGSMDEERRTPFSFSGYSGDQPILGEVWGSSFRLHIQRSGRNDFAPNFYGEFQPEAGGTRIEVRFRLAAFVQMFMCFWLGGVVLIGGAVFVSSLFDYLTGGHKMTDDAWTGLIVPPALLLFGIVLLGFGRMLGRDDETFILEHIQNILSARIDVPF